MATPDLASLRNAKNIIELKLNDHRNKCAVYLEPEVLQALTEFYKRVFTT